MDNPWECYGASFRSSLTLDAELPGSAMPNHYRFATRCVPLRSIFQSANSCQETVKIDGHLLVNSDDACVFACIL
jgi:hypothetical protein